ncbi:MAG: DUF302 domain-containing protein [Enterobacterales bacterium]|nr:DUF302 domain-containing protein [Enterobacterales bacterium]
MKPLHTLLFIIIIALPFQLEAKNPAVYQVSINKPIDDVYLDIQASMNDSSFFIVKELNIGENLKGMAERWGDEYNQSKLTGLRSMVFCSGWYANQVSNKDPMMLGLCPLHLTLIEKQGQTTVLFNRPSFIAQQSTALKVITEIEHKVIGIIEQALK